ncbi:hypothetical protein Tco_0723587 [Tanacetum coccineum]
MVGGHLQGLQHSLRAQWYLGGDSYEGYIFINFLLLEVLEGHLEWVSYVFILYCRPGVSREGTILTTMGGKLKPELEVEYIAAGEASMEAIQMRKFIDGLRNVVPTNKRPLEMLCDNMPAIAIGNDLGIMKGERLYQRKYHYIRKVIQDGEIVIKKVHIDDNIADLLMKPIQYTKHFTCMRIGV